MAFAEYITKHMSDEKNQADQKKFGRILLKTTFYASHHDLVTSKDGLEKIEPEIDSLESLKRKHVAETYHKTAERDVLFRVLMKSGLLHEVTRMAEAELTLMEKERKARRLAPKAPTTLLKY